MGQVSPIQGLLHLLLHCVAVASAMVACGCLLQLKPRWRIALLCIASFAAAFAAHIITFILLKVLIGGEVPPEIHRPIVGVVWGATSGLTIWLMQKRNPLAFFSTAFLATCAYFVFVLLRPHLP